MEQRISVLTIGADNLNAMKSFYGQVLGCTTVADNKDIAFYKLNGFLLSICDRKMLADFIWCKPSRRRVSPAYYATLTGHDEFKEQLSDYKQGKGSVQFPLNEKLPIELIADIVRFRVKENEKKTKAKNDIKMKSIRNK